MKLLNAYIENFGKISQMNFDFSSGLHIIHRENGWGKSTLAAFIKVMFYGFDGERKQSITQNERKRYNPWQSGTYGGSLSFEIAGKKYQISRSFGENSGKDFFECRDLKTNLISEDYSEKLGEEIFGIDAESFKNTIYISQNNSKNIETTGNIHAKLGDLVDAAMDIGDYEKAVKSIDKKLTALNGRTSDMSISRLKDVISQQMEEIRRGLQIDVQAKDLIQKKLKTKDIIENLKNQFQNLQKKKEELQEKNMAQKATIMAKKLNQDYLLDKIKEKQEQLSFLEKEYKDKTEGIEIDIIKSKNLKFIAMLSGVMLLLGMIFYFKIMFLGLALIFLGIIGLIYYTVFKKQYSMEQTMSKIKKIEGEIKLCQQEINQLKSECHENEKGLDKEDILIDQITELNRQSEDVKEKISDLLSQQAQSAQELILLQNQKEELSQMENDLSNNKERYQQLIHKQNLLKKSKDFLEQAKILFMDKYRNPILSGFEYYYQKLNPDNKNYMLDAKMSLTVNEMGLQRQIECLSTGYQDFIGLCMRMALIDAMYTKELPFIIMDDPFVNWDKAKIDKGLELLSQIGEKYQVIYFTCHESRT